MSSSLRSRSPPSRPASENKEENAVQTYSFRDLAHAIGLRYTSPFYCLAHFSAAFIVPSLAGMNILQQGVYYLWFMYPSMTHVYNIGAYYVTPSTSAKLSLRSILGRVFVSSLFAASVVTIGLSVTGRLEIPFVNDLARFGSRLIPSWVDSIASRIAQFATEELSDTTRQFIKFNFWSSVSYVGCFVSLGYYFRAIPDFVRRQWTKVVQSAIEIAKQRNK